MEISSDLVIAFREWLSATMVKAHAVDEGGDDSSTYKVQAKTIAGMLAAITGEDPVKLVDEARTRARYIFNSGQDWRRELRLWSNFNLRFWLGREA